MAVAIRGCVPLLSDRSSSRQGPSESLSAGAGAISAITLGLLEDSGWYQPQYQLADRMEWGSGAGCDFVERNCLECAKPTIPQYWCNSVGVAGCTANHRFKGFCNTMVFDKPIPAPFQYGLGDKPERTGGRVPMMDYCPFMEAPARPRASVLRCAAADVLWPGAAR
jgi:hypothetical protein